VIVALRQEGSGQEDGGARRVHCGKHMAARRIARIDARLLLIIIDVASRKHGGDDLGLRGGCGGASSSPRGRLFSDDEAVVGQVRDEGG